MDWQTIVNLPGAWFRACFRGNGNELALDEKQGLAPDPVKIRGGSWARGYYLILSGDLLTGEDDNPVRHEQCFVGLREDDHPDANGRACFEFYTEDTLRARLGSRGFELFVPAVLPSAPVGFPNKLVSPDGHLELDIQNADAPGAVLYQDGKAIGAVPLFPK